jgi:hypothetical protein
MGFTVDIGIKQIIPKKGGIYNHIGEFENNPQLI